MAPPQEQRRSAGLPGGGIEPARGLQVQRARLAQNRGHRARMQGFLHDAQDLGLLRTVDPDDAGRIEAQAEEARRMAIGLTRRPQEKTIVLAQNFRRHNCREGGHGRRQFALQAACAKFVERAKGKPTARQAAFRRASAKGKTRAFVSKRWPSSVRICRRKASSLEFALMIWLTRHVLSLFQFWTKN